MPLPTLPTDISTWTRGGVTGAPSLTTGITAPDGTNTAFELAFPTVPNVAGQESFCSVSFQPTEAANNTRTTFKIWMRAATPGATNLWIYNSQTSYNVSQPINVTSTWTQYTCTVTGHNVARQCAFGTSMNQVGQSGTAAITVQVWLPMLYTANDVADLPGSTIAYLPLDNSERDATNVNNGIPSNITYSPITYGNVGLTGVAAQFNGSSSSITLPNPSSFRSTEFSVSAWLRTKASGVAQPIFYNFYQATSAGFYFRVASSGVAEGAFGNNGGGAAVLATTSPVNDNNWHHLVLTYSKARADVWIHIDGITAAFFNSSGLVFGVSTPAIIGSGGANYFNGSMSRIAYFDRALSIQEVRALYNNGAGLGYPFSRYTLNTNRFNVGLD